MNYKPYRKHQIYCGIYDVPENGRVQLEDGCQWVIRKYLGLREGYGEGEFDDCLEAEGEIALLLDDGDNGFWPVISFLSKEEAISLADDLLESAGVYLQKEKQEAEE